MGIKCYSCQNELSLTAGAQISRQEECEYCYSSLHCCKMCTFYDPSAYNECSEPTADRVLDKEKANFCDFFKLSAPQKTSQNKDDILAAANSLFKK